MSSEAEAWANKQSTPSAHARSVLKELAKMCPSGTTQCFPRIRTLAAHCQLSERTVQRILRQLEAAELVVVEQRKREDGGDASRLYRLALTEPYLPLEDPVAVPRKRAGRGGDKLSPGGRQPVRGEGDTSVTPPVTLVSPHDGVLDSSGSYEPSQGAREVFDEVLKVWIGVGPTTSRTKPDEAWDAFQDEAAIVGAAALAGAADRALKADPDFQRRGPPGLQRWLMDRAYIAWMEHDPLPDTVEALAGPLGQALRRATEELGLPAAKKWLFGATFDAETNTIYAASLLAVDKLRAVERLASFRIEKRAHPASSNEGPQSVRMTSVE